MNLFNLRHTFFPLLFLTLAEGVGGAESMINPQFSSLKNETKTGLLLSIE
jgi:hypothetical protein